MQYNRNNFNPYYCGNCGKHGHPYRLCNEPIISMGIILIDIIPLSENDNIRNELIKALNCDDMYGKDKITIDTKYIIDLDIFNKYVNNIKFLIINRKHSLGYIEFVRGRYDVDSINSIKRLFRQMMKEEIYKIKTMTFDELWNDLWSTNRISKRNDYNKSKDKSEDKFRKLKSCKKINLDFYVKEIKPLWKHTEWGFPKGRRNSKESNLKCAIREFEEETNYTKDEYILCNKINPIHEYLTGTNKKKYKHTYYIALNKTNKKPALDPKNKHQINEIKNIGWVTHDGIIKLFRCHHIDKRKISYHIFMFILNKISEIKKLTKLPK